MIAATNNFKTANAARNKQPIFRFEIEGYARAFSTSKADAATPWISEISTQDQSINPLDGTSSIGDLTVTVLDRARMLTADLAATTFEGRIAALKCGFAGLALADYVTLFQGVLDSVPSANANTTYAFTCKDLNRLNKAVIYETGDDGRPTDSDHPKTVLGNPLDILLSVLRDYVGWADSDINIAKVTQYRDEMFGGMIFEFKITSPPEAKGFIETELLKPLAGWGYFDNLGRYTVDFLQPLGGATTPVYTFTDRNLIDVPTWEQVELVNTISCRFDSNGDKFMAEAIQKYADSIALYGQQGQQVIEATGVRSGFGGFSLMNMVSRAIFQRYGMKNPTFSVNALWESCLLEPGDYAGVTHALVPDRTRGVIGVADKLFQITGRTWDFSKCTAAFTLIDASQVKGQGVFRVAPDAIPAWSAANAYQRGRYLFVGNGVGEQSDGTKNGRLG